MRGEFLDLNGVRLYYYAAGSRGAGEPVVLLHGFPTSGHLWSDVVPLLPAGHRVVVLDLLGFGRSDPPPAFASVDLQSHADRLVAVLDSLGIDFACVVGHDIGGGVAQSVAVRYPQRVSRLGLIDSVAFDAWPTRSVRLARAILPVTRRLPPSLIQLIARAELLRGYMDRERGARDIDLYLRPFVDADGRAAFVSHLRSLDNSATQSIAPRLKDIVAPTAIVWGERDPFLPVRLGARLHALIPGSSFEIISEAKHFAPHESAHAVAGAIAALLKR